MSKLNIIITGSSGFIGYHLALYLLKNYKNISIFGIDNFSSYYDVSLKRNRTKQLKIFKNFHFFKLNITNQKSLIQKFKNFRINCVVHLAAQPGVRNSLDKPQEYFDCNILTHQSILEFCRKMKINKFFYASSSSIYGNSNIPFKENKIITRPESIYASTKLICENLSYAYSHNYKLQTIGLRFFTVYGSYGRPDMAYFDFTEKIINNKKITLFNEGKNYRDFTYIDDLIGMFCKILFSEKNDLFDIYNIGSSNPISTINFLKTLEKIIGKKALIKKSKSFKGDVDKTKADMNKFISKFGILKKTKLEDGLINFYDWYRKEYIK